MDETSSVRSPEAASAAADGADEVRRVSPVAHRSMTAVTRRPIVDCLIFGLFLFLWITPSSCAQPPNNIPTNPVVKSTALPTAKGFRILILGTASFVPSTVTSTATNPPVLLSPKTRASPAVVENQALPIVAQTATVEACQDAGQVEKTTTTDRSLVFLPGEPFYHSWRILNIGSCIWTVDYQLKSIDASKLGWPNSIHLPNQVFPGEAVEVISTFFAPQTQGGFAAEWFLADPEGEPVMIDSSHGAGLSLMITVRRNTTGKDKDGLEECT